MSHMPCPSSRYGHVAWLRLLVLILCARTSILPFPLPVAASTVQAISAASAVAAAASAGDTPGPAVSSRRLNWGWLPREREGGGADAPDGDAVHSSRLSGARRTSRCPGNCTAFGTCNEELSRCDCPRSRDGLDCSWLLPPSELLQRCRGQAYRGLMECQAEQSCLNGCNQRGVCVAGFCHCNAGHYGADCSLSLGPDGRPTLLAGGGYTTRTKKPWVYVYELPPHLTSWFNAKRLDRPLHLLFWQRLLSAGVRTADGDAADYYFIPVRQRISGESNLLVAAIAYIRENYPWWNRTGGGHRHLVIQTGDWGRAEVTQELRDLAVNITWLTHWGLTTNRTAWKRPAFRPDKDVVLPVYISAGHFQRFGITRSPLHPFMAAQDQSRTNATLFFAGRICSDPRKPDAASWPTCGIRNESYAAGIREQVHVWHWNRTGFHVVRSEPQYGAYMAGSTFCLAPPGAGHGQRQIQALFMGCVPVTIADKVSEPFEPALSWDDWGVRVAEADIPRLHTLLAAIKPRHIAAKRSRMYCAAQHMLYSSITGSVLGESGRFDAFETTLELLRVRRAHPDASPRDYRRLDPDFAAFLDCKGAPTLCSHAVHDSGREDVGCARLLMGGGHLGVPGGAICAHNESRSNLAACPRLWE